MNNRSKIMLLTVVALSLSTYFSAHPAAANDTALSRAEEIENWFALKDTGLNPETVGNFDELDVKEISGAISFNFETYQAKLRNGDPIEATLITTRENMGAISARRYVKDPKNPKEDIKIIMPKKFFHRLRALCPEENLYCHKIAESKL